MKDFFIGMEPEQALDLATMAKRAFDSREQRKELLAASGFEDSDALLQAVRDGQVDVAAGYETWLRLALLQEQHDALRRWIDWRCRHPDGVEEPSVSPWADLLEQHLIPEDIAARLTLHPDAITLTGPDLMAIARIVSATEWALQWTVEGRNWRLDTALHEDDKTSSSVRLQCPDGSIRADPWGFHGLPTRGEVLQRFLTRLADTPEP